MAAGPIQQAFTTAQPNRTNFAFDDRAHARLTVLVDAKFATPKHGGSAALLRHLINQAWSDPQKFGLLPPEPIEEAQGMAGKAEE